MVEIEGTQVAKTLDCKGLLCPIPVYRASQAIKELEPGEVLEVVCTDPGSLKDFPAFARQTGHELLASKTEDQVMFYYLRKGGSA